MAMAANPHPVDVHVGGRIRLRRTMLGMNQTNLGDALGLTFQQVQKYENGANRVSASRLFQLSKVLNVSVPFFFDDMPEKVTGPKSHPQETLEPFADNPLTKSEILEFVRTYYRLPTAHVRKRVFELAKALAKMTNPD